MVKEKHEGGGTVFLCVCLDLGFYKSGCLDILMQLCSEGVRKC